MVKRTLITFGVITAVFAIVIIGFVASDAYKITFDLNYPDVTVFTVMGESKIKRNGMPVPEREGYEFTGWFFDSDSCENKFDFDSVDNLKGDVRLYARWHKLSCDVTFNVMGGTIVSGNEAITVSSGEVVNPPIVEYRGINKFFAGWYTDEDFNYKWNDSKVYDDLTLYAKWGEYYDNDMLILPKLHIDMLGAERVRKSVYLPIRVTLTHSDVDFTNVSAEIRGRGNSTWSEFIKKPYRLKFDKKIDLFGMGARKDWILLANAMDHTLMRNYLTFILANEMDDPYTSQSQWIHLFLDDDYVGVYLLCEQTESGEFRVDIETEHTSTDLDVGYFIEYGGSADVDDRKFFNFKRIADKRIIYQMTDHNAVIKYPKAETCTNAQRDYIADYCNKTNDAILRRRWNDILELVDIDTFVDNFIVTEIMLNNDMGWNFFFYKPAGGKLSLGPHWDYDQAAGGSDYGGETYEGWNAGSPHPWFEALVQIDEFMELVKERWIEYRDFFHSIPESFIDEVAEQYQHDIDANFIRWRVLGVPHWRSVRSLDKQTTYEGHIQYLKTWLTNRLAWIESQLGI